MLLMMDQRLRHFLDGFLSAFDLFPVVEPLPELRFRRRSAEEAMRETWLAVGGCIRRALDEVRDELGESEGRPSDSE